LLKRLHIKLESVIIELLISLILAGIINFQLYSVLSPALQLIVYKILILSLAVVHARIVRKLLIGNIDIKGDEIRAKIDSIAKNQYIPNEIKSSFIFYEISLNALKIFFVCIIYLAFIIGYSLAI